MKSRDLQVPLREIMTNLQAGSERKAPEQELRQKKSGSKK